MEGIKKALVEHDKCCEWIKNISTDGYGDVHPMWELAWLELISNYDCEDVHP